MTTQLKRAVPASLIGALSLALLGSASADEARRYAGTVSDDARALVGTVSADGARPLAATPDVRTPAAPAEAAAETAHAFATRAETAPLGAFGAATALSAAELAEKRAMANIEIDRITINDSNQDGAVTDNIAVNSDTGRNTIGADAFAGADGFINAVQNTGNNVLIQSATIINVSIEP